MQSILIIATCAAVLLLGGLIAVIVIFSKKSGKSTVSNAAISSPTAKIGAAKTTVYCCKTCGGVVEKGTRICPHCGVNIGSNKVRRTKIFASCCCVLLFASLAGNIGLSLYVRDLNGELVTANAVVEENKTNKNNLELLSSELESYKTKLNEAYKENENLQNNILKILEENKSPQQSTGALYQSIMTLSELMKYQEAVALLNQDGVSHQQYHTFLCPKLHDSFYIYSVTEAKRDLYCTPCPDCH